MFCFTGPEPPVKLEKMEETTNKISLALETQEEGLKTKPGECFSLFASDGFFVVKPLLSSLFDLNVYEGAALVRQRRITERKREVVKRREAISTCYQLWVMWRIRAET